MAPTARPSMGSQWRQGKAWRTALVPGESFEGPHLTLGIEQAFRSDLMRMSQLSAKVCSPAGGMRHRLLGISNIDDTCGTCVTCVTWTSISRENGEKTAKRYELTLSKSRHFLHVKSITFSCCGSCSNRHGIILCQVIRWVGLLYVGAVIIEVMRAFRYLDSIVKMEAYTKHQEFRGGQSSQ